ncbi:UNVERIFIED_CONTAM: protein BIG GRAIN 1-like E [Sesamum calycinum]|uniref:Protein BIG GRAIN 1-like E n=1 Tax=Sesamum calycinum TaxID=2727403 RepID=A0AAW2QXM4_9LAMI
MSMSVTGFSSDPNKMYKNSFHCRNDSGELDVFEAAGYFSSVNTDQSPGAYIINGANFAQKFIREEKQQHVQRARMSLDMPIRNPVPAEYHIMDQKQMIKENKKHKQPSSPGGRLASFLNSLFSQTHLKKKKSKSGSTMKDSLEEESPGGRRKRRSSISHFRITSSTISSTAASTDSKSSLFSSSSSGFRTPPPYANTPQNHTRNSETWLISSRRFPGLKTAVEFQAHIGESAVCGEKSHRLRLDGRKIQNQQRRSREKFQEREFRGDSNQEFHHELGIQEVQ